jgi:ATP-binding cassette, subfamily B (MDR/TAP), member 1
LKRKRKETKEEQIKEKNVEDEAKDVVEFPPVPFFALFRFTTRSEMFINFIGIACAIAAGAAQVSIPFFSEKYCPDGDTAAYDAIVWQSNERLRQVWKGRTGTCCQWSNT